MAGAGFKTWATGDVLTASDQNTYLMEQSVMVFADATARDAAVTSPTEGMHCFLKDTDALQFYDGSSWTASPTGDVTAVNAGTNIDVTDSGGPTPTVALAIDAEVAAADQIISRPVFKDYGETTVTNATSGATETLDLESGNVFDLTLTDNCTLTFSNPPTSGTSGSFTLILRQDGTGSRTVTWPGSVDWAAATAPTLTTDASAVDVLTFMTVDGGTVWLGFVAGQALG